ncbi:MULTISPECIES: hypothetical protein [Streptomyces]|uniref:KTSC domain-containing protein n=1 Tax=Streptomyces lasiicapitis TaxID=1923961 RepID=A0ABQ2M808_9ACTN|nr:MULTISPECIES: hypothetical protein [Streptomyces]QIB42126.1 hypothetical protein G3H79_02570 [Streptomyces aureoverticillatus]GGO48184.1 hypothetical protein GCM10012286_43200 [Streptomyces lasiicapitis]
MSGANGFTYEERRDGSVVVWHHGRQAAQLRDGRAKRFLEEVTSGDAQLVMARWTGNYRRGNERSAREHPRNVGGRR